MIPNKALTSYVSAFVDELVNADVTDVVVSPGSRSTPIAMLMAEHPGIHVYLNIDERSAGFFALGIAKAKRKPVALVCTSGTAAANYYPAVVEAFQSRVPLIVITADRPHELRDVGAPQAINQLHLFGQYAKWFAELALPENTESMLRYIRTTAARAVGTSLTAPAGPVHLNFPLREPLVPSLSHPDLWAAGREEKRKQVKVHNGALVCPPAVLEEAVMKVKQYERGIIVCGDHEDAAFTDAVVKLAEKLNYPILADPLSQLRSGKHEKKHIVNAYDTFLRNESLLEDLKPEVVIRFGAMPVSKSLLLFLKKYEPEEMMVIDGGGGWREPTLIAADMIQCEETYFCRELGQLVGELSRTSTKWLDKWLFINEKTTELLQKSMEEDTLLEGKVVTELAGLLPDSSTLFVGNSMPIRDVDTFFSLNEKSIKIMANRGANGIDGVVSSALGVSVIERPTVLLIGDLSFYHDLNGLLAAKMNELNLTVILVNNDGGGIFSFLPQSKEEKHFEFLFGTPTGIEFDKAVQMYGGDFKSIKTWEEFRQAVTQSLTEKGLKVIEIKTNRGENVMVHREMWKSVSQEMNEWIKMVNGV
ncbi:2-succinyl-5-enolpyruvyl-6-hydroxy-3-cyclohexene-1-carboxylic-acid synthase [Priestia abyssalis]|uniref:2-succinyl-5-enolpyruvyl-6-hydroxy-3- cyclohexene-1-carboxylic-acid synthase n=1 Tax=Priestia abyssalis TaxID=1221450 RepID=UPI000994DCEC|nr:2-succinyl-5-enolpyruvyl-6-hydroxy-3-cyclohexene-1-carboxylic-acid synthase [Priestia abyssalis]